MALRWRSRWPKGALNTRKKVYAAIRYAATFHDDVAELVDVEEVREEDKKKQAQMTIWPQGGRMVTAAEGRKKSSVA